MKTFTLFKRSDQRDAPYYFKFTFRGKTWLRCLQTNDAAIAQQRARALHKEITESIITGQFERLDATKTRHTVHATLAELIAAYRQSPVDAAQKTRESNINALYNVLRRANVAADVNRLNSTPYPQLLTAVTAAKFFAQACFETRADDQTENVRKKRTANSLWLQAASICAPRAIAYYKTLGIYHDCLDAFSNAGILHRFTRLPRIEYNPPADDMIQKTLAAWEAFEDRNVFLAIGQILAFGLRADEVAQSRTSWWTTRHGYPVLDGEARVKNKTGIVQVRALDPFYTTMRVKAISRGWLTLGTGDSPVITGSDSYRDDGFEREVSAFLRSHGWETQKTNHALRAYAGSQVAMKYGIYEAQTWLRHSSVKVTESAYSHFIRKFKPQNLDDIPARWAVLDQAPILSIVQAAEQ